MIVRLWRGWTTAANADGYEELIRSTIFPDILDLGDLELKLMAGRPAGQRAAAYARLAGHFREDARLKLVVDSGPVCIRQSNFYLAPETPSAHNAIMAEAPIFRTDITNDAARPGRYRWMVFENLKLRDKSLHSFATKREAQLDADKFVARLNDIWKSPR